VLGGVDGALVASGHSSHCYAQGANIYFTFVLKPADFADAERLYLESWSRALRATLDGGGTISHHHGIGRLRASWLAEELGSAYPLLRALKRALDPSGMMNPGALIAMRRGGGAGMVETPDKVAALTDATRALAALGAPHALVGSVAVGVHSGEPRATADTDIAVL